MATKFQKGFGKNYDIYIKIGQNCENQQRNTNKIPVDSCGGPLVNEISEELQRQRRIRRSQVIKTVKITKICIVLYENRQRNAIGGGDIYKMRKLL